MSSWHGKRLCAIAACSVALCGATAVFISMFTASGIVPHNEPDLMPPFVSVVSGNETIHASGKGIPVTNPSPALRMLFVGDIMLDREVANRMRRTKDPAYPFRLLPAGWISSFDYAVANLEGPVTDEYRPPVKTIDFRFDSSVLPTLAEQGFDAFSQANNHALDQGRIGYSDSMRRLREHGFLAFGDQVQDDHTALATTTVNGTSFAFLGFNTTDNALDRAAASSVIATASEMADQVIVYMHWGPEYRDRPHPNEVELAHWFIDRGVDIVIGGHPHWEQGVSTYKGKPILWSLGNFIFDQDWSERTREGLATALVFEEEELSIELYPVRIDRSQPRLVEGEERRLRLERLAAISDEGLASQVAEGVVLFEK